MCVWNVLTIGYTQHSDMPLPHTPCKFYIITQFTTVFLTASSPTHHMMHYLAKFGYKKRSMKAKNIQASFYIFWLSTGT